MSHVDEGTLHAYLDGALDTLPAAEAERVRRHLAACDVCQARLEEERAVRDEAAAILGGVPLDLGELPSFEETRALARVDAAAPGFRMQRLAWAASVVLALGTGWMLRGGVPPTAERVGAAREDVARPTAPAPADVRDEATDMDDIASNTVQRAEEESVGASGQGAASANAPGVRDREVDARADARAQSGDVLPSAAATDPAVQVARGFADAPARVAGDSASADAPTPAELGATGRLTRQLAQEKATAPAQPGVSEPAASRRAIEPLAEEARSAVTRANALVPEGSGLGMPHGSSLVIPGLPVVAVAWMEEPELSGAVRVLQLMEGGDTLELVHLPAGVAPARLPAVGDGRTQVLSPREGGWLVLRAHASADVLSALLRRLGSGD